MRPACYGYTRRRHRIAAAVLDACGGVLRRRRQLPSPVRRMLLIRFERFGDLILLLPALTRARACFPGSAITLLVRGEYIPFLAAADLGIELLSLEAALRTPLPRFDLALELHGHPRWILFARRHARWVAGHGIRGAGFLLDLDLPWPSAPTAFIEAVAAACGTAFPAAAELPRLRLAPAWAASAAQLLRQRVPELASGAYLIFHPGCGQPSKRWPEQRWRALLDWCCAAGLPVLLAGGPDDQCMCQALAAGRAGVASIAGAADWSTLAGLVARARAVAAPDTAIVHLARALGVPTLALFGPTAPARWAAAAGPRDRVLAHHLACSPCDRGRCPRLTRSADPSAFSPCLEAIAAIQAWRALQALLLPTVA